MDNIKNDSYYLKRIIQDVDFIINHTDKLTLEEFQSDELLQDSMMFRLIQISETSIRLSDEFKEQNFHVPWFAIKGLRNRIVHDYGNVDLTITYQTIIRDIPEVSKSLKAL